jgi:hypothetical protein
MMRFITHLLPLAKPVSCSYRSMVAGGDEFPMRPSRHPLQCHRDAL